jgi:hypothetical protein
MKHKRFHNIDTRAEPATTWWQYHKHFYARNLRVRQNRLSRFKRQHLETSLQAFLKILNLTGKAFSRNEGCMKSLMSVHVGNCNIDFYVFCYWYHLMSLKFLKFARVQNFAKKFWKLGKRKSEITKLDEIIFYYHQILQNFAIISHIIGQKAVIFKLLVPPVS